MGRARKRTLAVGCSSRAEAVDVAVEMLTHVVPPFVEYCHTPCAAGAPLDTTTTPAKASAVEPPTTSSALSSNRASKRELTVASGGVRSPCAVMPSDTLLAVLSGASLMRVTITGSV